MIREATLSFQFPPQTRLLVSISWFLIRANWKVVNLCLFHHLLARLLDFLRCELSTKACFSLLQGLHNGFVPPSASLPRAAAVVQRLMGALVKTYRVLVNVNTPILEPSPIRFVL